MAEQHPSLPRLMIVSSGKEHLSDSSLAMKQALHIARSAQPVIFQLREKSLTASALLQLGHSIATLFNDGESILVINERFDIALAAGARGVHFPESSCPADAARKAVRGLLAGQSAHSEAAALSTASAGLDYLLFGPVFHTPSKAPFGPPQGLERLGKICSKLRIPVFAVGGITPDKVPACIEKGAYGVAALAPFLDTGSLPEVIKHYYSFMPL
jgi:thiamine-phosphate pyrophosphorylase